jgi:hypothetical protein
MASTMLLDPMVGAVLFVMGVFSHALTRANERARPLNALSGCVATWLAVLCVAVPADAWWAFFMRVGGAIRFVGDPVLDAGVAMGWCFALAVAWLCIVSAERGGEHPNAAALRFAALNRASLTLAALYATGYALVNADGVIVQPMMMAAHW